jgi:hypothetical protein
MTINNKADSIRSSEKEMQVRQRLAHLYVYGIDLDTPHLGSVREMPPLWLLSLYLLFYTFMFGCLHIHILIHVFVSILIIWCGGLIYNTFNSVHNVVDKYNAGVHLKDDMRSYVLSAQMGEIPCKQDRRDLYARRVSCRTRTRSKPNERKYRKAKRLLHKMRETFSPQSGVGSDMVTALERLASVQNIALDDTLLSRVENLAACFIAARNCTTVSGFMATMFLYMKTHYNKSVCNLAAEYMCDILETQFDPQSSSFSISEDNEKPPWLLALRSLKDNWTLAIQNEGFSKLSHLLSLCLALGLCDASKLDFKVAGMKLFSIGAYNKHTSAVDLVDAAFETVIYFVEGGYTCFQHKSVKPLLYGNLEVMEFEELYAKCLRCNEYARCGNLEKYENMTENDYEDLLSKTIEKVHMLKMTSKGIVERNLLSKKGDILRQWQATFRQTRVQGGLREAPYSIGIFGGTAVGKSTIANILMVTTLQCNGYCADDDRIVTINEADKFMSNFRSHTNGILVDDIGNTKANFVERAPTALMIQLVNNVRMYANMAEADMKGKVSVEPKVVIATKNVKDSCAHVYSNEPASIARRDRITLTVKVKPEYARHSMLDPDKIPNLHSCRIPNFWDITVERAYPTSRQTKNGAAIVAYEAIRYDGKDLVNIGLPELIRWIAQDSKKFFADQKEVVKKSNNLGQQLHVCSKCKLPKPDVCICSIDPVYKERMDDNCVEGWCNHCGFHHHPLPTVVDSGTPPSLAPPSLAPIKETPAVADDVSVLTDASMHSAKEKVPVLARLANFLFKIDDTVDTFNKVEVEPVIDMSKEIQADLQAKRENRPLPSTAHLKPGCDDDSDCMTATGELEPDPLDAQFGEDLVWYLIPKIYTSIGAMRDWWNSSTVYVEHSSIKWMMDRLDRLENSSYFVWTNYIPSDMIDLPWVRSLVLAIIDERPQNLSRFYYGFALMTFGIFLISLQTHILFNIFQCVPLLCIGWIVRREKEDLYDKIISDNKSMPHIFKVYRDRHAKWMAGTCMVIGTMYLLAQVYKSFRNMIPQPQGVLDPKTDEDIDARDAEENPWAGAFASAMPCSEASKTTVVSTLEKMVESNLCHLVFIPCKSKKRGVCNAFFPKSNVALIPKHIWQEDEMKATFTRHDPTKIGGNFECYLSRDWSVDIPDTDLSLVWIPNGGDWKDLTPYLPTGSFKDVPGRLIHKQKDGNIIRSKLRMRPQIVATKAETFDGAVYDLEFNTFEGLCMSPIVTETKGPTIGGFHLGGRTGKTFGCSGTLYYYQIEAAFEQLKSKPGIIASKSSGTVPKELYDINFYSSDDIHPKSPINFLPEGTNCKYYGQVTGRASYYSEVVPTVISDTVEKVCGVEQKWSGPKFRKGYPWQASLQHSARPSCGVEATLVNKAITDYVTGFISHLKKFTKLVNRLKPLSRIEVVSGIDGLRFIDKMPPNTSVGFPLSGPKKDHLTPLNPEDYPNNAYPMELDEMFWNHAEQMEALYLQGERAYPIFKACLKDEATKITKDKVRVFQGAPVAFQLLVRKYYLPIARSLSMLPLVSECAVGVNSQGPEWDELSKHMMKFGSARILAGDYSKYDLRMPAQIILAAFRCMIDIAVDAGYSEKDIKIMEGIATDIAYPLMAYNGDLIQHIGSNPSGQNLTVYVNSIVNSLLLRCAYYHSLGLDAPPFRHVCALMTYGDDCKGSVADGYDKFNHIAVAEFLAAHDMKFTMPDKTSDPTPYMQDQDADFLKRKNVYCADTGYIMGALDEESIFKSLHAVIKSGAITPEQQAMQNIDGALREWFNHGREVYELRRAQMKKVAEEHGISHGCNLLESTYDDRLAVWRNRYLGEPLPTVEEEELELDLGGSD